MPTPKDERFVEVDSGVELFCEILGDGDQTVIVTSASWLAAEFERLVDGRRLVFVDPRGRGRSSAIGPDEPVTKDCLIDDLEKVRAAIGSPRVSVLGWSIGGGTAAGMAMRYPDRVERVLTVGWFPPRQSPFSDEDRVEAGRRFTDRRGSDRSAEVDALRATGAPLTDPAGFARAEVLAMAATQVQTSACSSACVPNRGGTPTNTRAGGSRSWADCGRAPHRS